ncbi:MAG: nickel/cobalt transporter [Gammaproteobacteria bacterium]
MNRWYWLLLGWLWISPSFGAAPDPFGPRPQPAPDQAAEAPTAQPRFTLWDRAVTYVKIQQQRYYRKLAGAVKSLKKEGSLTAAWTLALLSLVYGVFHAAGPGHGKAVISAYLLANQEQIKRGLLLSGAAALVQAVTAIALVSVVVIALKATGLETQQTVRNAEYLSYGLIVLIGAWLLVDTLRRAGRRRQEHEHGDQADCGHHHVVVPDHNPSPSGWWSDLSVIGAIGIRPCSGAVLVLLFSYSLGIYLAGIAAAFAMAVGTAITVGVLATLTLTSKRVLLAFMDSRGTLTWSVFLGLRIAGGLAMIFVGLLLLDAAWNTPVPFI